MPHMWIYWDTCGTFVHMHGTSYMPLRYFQKQKYSKILFLAATRSRVSFQEFERERKTNWRRPGRILIFTFAINVAVPLYPVSQWATSSTLLFFIEHRVFNVATNKNIVQTAKLWTSQRLYDYWTRGIQWCRRYGIMLTTSGDLWDSEERFYSCLLHKRRYLRNENHGFFSDKHSK